MTELIGTKKSSEGKAEDFFEFRDVCKSFDDNAVLKNVSFTVKRGETCVIMGRSGVGKSVSLKHIMGFM
ncbi:MAG: ATP-binding cassette domain-containing protein, partial [Candidatus Acidiferrum sp.]